MKNKDNIKFIITLLLFLLPIFSEEMKKYPSLSWVSAGLGSIVALMTNARGVFIIKNLINFVFPEVSVSFETSLSGAQRLTEYIEKEIKNENKKSDQSPPDDFEAEIKSICLDLERGLLAYATSKRSSGK